MGMYTQPFASIPVCFPHKQRCLMYVNSRTPLIKHIGTSPYLVLRPWYQPARGIVTPRHGGFDATSRRTARSPTLPAGAFHDCCGVLCYISSAENSRLGSLLFLQDPIDHAAWSSHSHLQHSRRGSRHLALHQVVPSRHVTDSPMHAHLLPDRLDLPAYQRPLEPPGPGRSPCQQRT